MFAVSLQGHHTKRIRLKHVQGKVNACIERPQGFYNLLSENTNLWRQYGLPGHDSDNWTFRKPPNSCFYISCKFLQGSANKVAMFGYNKIRDITLSWIRAFQWYPTLWDANISMILQNMSNWYFNNVKVL